MRRVTAALLGTALALTACGGDEGPDAAPTAATTSAPAVAPTLDALDPAAADDGAGDEASPSSSASEVAASPSPEPSATASDGDDAPTASEAERLEPMAPDELAIGLVVVDAPTGAVSWFDGFDFLTFDVDAALDGQRFEADGAGGLVIEAADRSLWHLPEPSDDPALLLRGPGEDWTVVQSLVGAGLRDGRPTAWLELGTVSDPENTTSDLVALDLATGKQEVVLEAVSGWESGLGDASVGEEHLLLTVFAEGWVGVDARRRKKLDEPRLVYEDNFVEVHSTLDTARGRDTDAWLLVQDDDFAGWTVARRDLAGDDFDLDRVPDHDQVVHDLAVHKGAVVVSGEELTLVRPDPYGGPWFRLEVEVPGVVVLAPGFALG